MASNITAGRRSPSFLLIPASLCKSLHACVVKLQKAADETPLVPLIRIQLEELSPTINLLFPPAALVFDSSVFL